jgi:hypothetical protein
MILIPEVSCKEAITNTGNMGCNKAFPVNTYSAAYISTQKDVSFIAAW